LAARVAPSRSRLFTRADEPWSLNPFRTVRDLLSWDPFAAMEPLFNITISVPKKEGVKPRQITLGK
jgi:hypothetical protein